MSRVGTGFSDKQREQLWRDRDQVVGRVAKVESQKAFASGKLRAPSFKEFHIQAEALGSMSNLHHSGNTSIVHYIPPHEICPLGNDEVHMSF